MNALKSPSVPNSPAIQPPAAPPPALGPPPPPGPGGPGPGAAPTKKLTMAEELALKKAKINQGKAIDENNLNHGTDDGGGAAPAPRAAPKETMFEEMARKKREREAKLKAAQEAGN